MKRQVFVIHGGDSFETYEAYLDFLKNWKINFEDYLIDKNDWKRTLREKLGPDFQVIRPEMPSKRNAKYLEWKMWFEKFIPYFEPGVILVGHSLGALFLAKYLSENRLPQKTGAIFLMATPWGEGDFSLSDDLGLLNFQGPIYLYHSEDDRVVSASNLNEYKSRLNNIIVRVFKDRGHFNQEELPELVEDIKSVAL